MPLVQLRVFWLPSALAGKHTSAAFYGPLPYREPMRFKAEIHEMLETATDDQRAAVARIAAQLSPESGTELEKLDAVHDNLLERERALKTPVPYARRD